MARWGYYVSAYQHAVDALQAAAYAYRVDLWSQADTYDEVWTESRSMAGVIRDVICPERVDLAGHGHVAADHAPRQRGHHRGHHRDPGRGLSLRAARDCTWT